jgi:hypothetical protein
MNTGGTSEAMIARQQSHLITRPSVFDALALTIRSSSKASNIVANGRYDVSGSIYLRSRQAGLQLANINEWMRFVSASYRDPTFEIAYEKNLEDTLTFNQASVVALSGC